MTSSIRPVNPRWCVIATSGMHMGADIDNRHKATLDDLKIYRNVVDPLTFGHWLETDRGLTVIGTPFVDVLVHNRISPNSKAAIHWVRIEQSIIRRVGWHVVFCDSEAHRSLSAKTYTYDIAPRDIRDLSDFLFERDSGALHSYREYRVAIETGIREMIRPAYEPENEKNPVVVTIRDALGLLPLYKQYEFAERFSPLLGTNSKSAMDELLSDMLSYTCENRAYLP